MRISKAVTLFACLFLFAANPGCLCGGDAGDIMAEAMKAASEAAAQAQAQQAAAQPVMPADPDAMLFEKLGGYIDCINDTSNSVRDTHARYVDWVNPKKGPTCKERNVYGLYELGADAATVCNEAVNKGRTLQPALPMVDAAAAEVAMIYAQLQPINDKAETYYEQEDWKDDKCAFAKQAHPQMMDLYTRFFAAMDRLKAGMDKVKGEADMRQLALLEQGGRTFPWQVKRMMIFSKKFVDLYPDGADPKKTTKAQYLPVFTEFEPVYKEFDIYSKGNKAEIDNIMFASSFVDASEEFYTQAKMLKRNYEGKKKVKPRDVNSMIEKYNRFVAAAGNISFN